MTILNNRPVMDKIDTYSLRGICMLMIIVHHVYKVFVSDYGYPSNVMDGGYGQDFFNYLKKSNDII